MSATRKFHLSALVSVSSGIFVCVGGVGDLYKFLNHMTGDNLMTHQLPLASGAVKPDLLAQHPWLADVTVPDGITDEASLAAWLVPAVERWGEWHEVTPNPAAWGSHDPIEDFVAMGADPSRIVIVDADGDVR